MQIDGRDASIRLHFQGKYELNFYSGFFRVRGINAFYRASKKYHFCDRNDEMVQGMCDLESTNNRLDNTEQLIF